MRQSRLTRCTIKLVVLERYTALSNDNKMVAILHRELERKIEIEVGGHAAKDQK